MTKQDEIMDTEQGSRMPNEKKRAEMLPLFLTIALCCVSFVCALNFGLGSGLFGVLLLAGASGILAVLFLNRTVWIAVANAIASLLILYFASGALPFVPALGAVFFFSAWILAVCLRKRTAKTTAAIGVAVCLAIGILIVSAVFYAAQGNSLKPADLSQAVSRAFQEIKQDQVAKTKAEIEALPESAFALYEKMFGMTKEMFLEASISNTEAYVDYIQLLLPGAFVAILQVLAGIALLVTTWILKMFGLDILLPMPKWAYCPTQTSCTVFMIVTLLYILMSFFGSASFFSIVVTNLCLILIPGMAACGVRGVIARLRARRRRGRMLFLLLLAIIGCMMAMSVALPAVVILLSFLGAKDVSAARMAYSEKNKKE